jgi:hypothetical protein
MLDAWQGFFQAVAGASATLAGLLVVAISINIDRILALPSLPDRAAAALIPLASIMVIALLALVPAQPPAIFGIEVLLIAAASWLASMFLVMRAFPGLLSAQQIQVQPVLQLALNQAQTLSPLLAGFLLALRVGGATYWLVPGVVATLVAGVVNAWVLLVEILR